ncbi:MAG: hypothetical protein AB8B94_00990 [Hyphomicrobiales bacterium]
MTNTPGADTESTVLSVQVGGFYLMSLHVQKTQMQNDRPFHV